MELPDRRALVAGLALHCGVHAHQREAVLVLANGLHGDLPAANRMASLAVGSHLSVVKVRVTIRAVLPHIGKDWFDVALRAGYFLVQAAERIARRVVIEFGDCPDRAPARVGVAIFARNGQSAVRTPGTLPLCGSRRSEKRNQNGWQNPIPEQKYFQFTAPGPLGIARPGCRVSKDIDSSYGSISRKRQELT